MEKNELTNTIHTTLCPRAVLIAYTYAQDKKYFLEQRSIDAKGRMGEGHPYIWYNPPRKRMMYFVENLGIENAQYNLPGIIYQAKETQLDVYAYKDNLPDMETALYAAPLFNVTGSSVCIGSARIEKPRDLTYANLLEYWEKKFWLTEFSHLGSNGNPTRSNLVLVTKAARDRDFNLDELKPLNNMKLKDILK